MQPDPRTVARRAGLRYVEARRKGITRTRRRDGFAYRGSGVPRMSRHMDRIRKLAIPPAWTDVWICADPRGHLQATGIDARGRLQYRYHPDWRAARDLLKFDRMLAFAKVLPRIRRGIARDLAQAGLPRTKVLAAIVRLLEESLIRVGSDEYARDNGSFGLTTLRKRHVRVNGAAAVLFRFAGKSNIRHEIRVLAPRVAAVIRSCQKLPGRDLFQFEDEEGGVHDITAADVNDYLGDLAGTSVTAKDFRTWGATVLLHRALLRAPPAATVRAREQQLRAAIAEVADALGNTVAVCRKSYVHPALPARFRAGTLPEARGRQPVFGRRNLSALEKATVKRLKESMA